MPEETLVIINDNQWSVSVARTPAELTTGLSGVESIPAGTGMLFVIHPTQVVTVDTTQMLFPIDIIFIKDDTVLSIASNIQPGYLVEEATPVDMFLEVNALEADLVEVGDIVTTTTIQAPGIDWGSMVSSFMPLAMFGIALGILGVVMGSGSSSNPKRLSNPRKSKYYLVKHEYPPIEIGVPSSGRELRVHRVFIIVKDYPGITFTDIWVTSKLSMVEVDEALGRLEREGYIRKEEEQGGYTWQIINHAVGEKHESTTSYKDRTYTLSSAYNFIEEELKVGHPLPTEKGYEIKILNSKGEVVYTEWYVPKWMKEHHSLEWKQLEPDWWALSEKVAHEGRLYDAEIVEIRGGYEPRITMTTKEGAVSAVSLKALNSLEEAKKATEDSIFGRSIHGEPRKRLVEKYGSWAVGRAEAICPEDDVECVTREAKRLIETIRVRYGGEAKYLSIIDPGSTVFHEGDTVSLVALERENKRVRDIGLKEATAVPTKY